MADMPPAGVDESPWPRTVSCSTVVVVGFKQFLARMPARLALQNVASHEVVGSSWHALPLFAFIG